MDIDIHSRFYSLFVSNLHQFKKFMRHKLEVDDVQLEFGTRKILSNIYLRCETGKITGLLGRNGQGKSCLMNVIYGNLNVLSKSVRFDNMSVPRAFTKPQLLVYLPQFNFIPGSLSLKKIFSHFNSDYSFFESSFPDFKPKYYTRISSLSGGQRRLVEVYLIAKAKSQFAMLDEPFSHLMPLQIEKMIEILNEEKNYKGLLVTDHMYRYILTISDDLFVLKDGKSYLTKSLDDIEALGYARI